MAVDGIILKVDAVAESERNPVSKSIMCIYVCTEVTVV